MGRQRRVADRIDALAAFLCAEAETADQLQTLRRDMTSEFLARAADPGGPSASMIRNILTKAAIVGRCLFAIQGDRLPGRCCVDLQPLASALREELFGGDHNNITWKNARAFLPEALSRPAAKPTGPAPAALDAALVDQVIARLGAMDAEQFGRLMAAIHKESAHRLTVASDPIDPGGAG